MGRPRLNISRYILLILGILMLSGCAQVLGELAGAAVRGIASGIVGSIEKKRAENKAEKMAEQQKEAQQTRGELAKAEEMKSLEQGSQGTGEEASPPKEEPSKGKEVADQIMAKLDKKELKFNNVSAVLSESADGKNNLNKIKNRLLDENETNKIIEILKNCDLYDESTGKSLLNIAFSVEGRKCQKATYSFKCDNNYHTITVGDQQISYKCGGSPEIYLDKKLSCNFLETVKKDIAMKEQESDEEEG